MNLGTTKGHLVNAINLAERIAGKKETLPVLSCVLLEAGSNTLTVRATNLEAGIEITIPATVEDKGMVAIPAGVISQTIRSITGDAIKLKGQDGNLSVESRGSKNLIKAIPHEEFPSLPVSNEKQGFTMSRERFISGVSAVIYAASPSMIRPELGSVYVAIDSGNITVVATDSFRLAEKTVKGVTKKESGELLIPLKHAQELLFILERLDTEDITIVAEEAQISVSGSGVRFVSRVVDAQFPNYKEIVPKTFMTEATLLKNDFLEILRKARVFSGNENHVGFHVYPKRKIFSAIARSSEIGEMSDVLDAAVSGEDIDINFHIGYLSDCLSSIQSDSIQLGFAGTGRPLVIRGVSDASFMYLVMPLNR
ncbi:DNA polymerase III subunit beta [Candidatus Parcubacteria bacterium]|nr:MAG: DNA polymerase III subunit beta [Candidatus Parcubacteria bacterium]